MAFAGECRCGAVSYRVEGDIDPAVFACHCQACQRWSGSAFTEQCVVAADDFTITGEVLEFEYQTRSAATSRHRACARCFARIYNVNDRLPDMIILRAGTRESSPEAVPVLHIWTSRKQPWLNLPEGTPAFEENAPPEEFRQLLGLG